jgi:hypothetical protein
LLGLNIGAVPFPSACWRAAIQAAGMPSSPKQDHAEHPAAVCVRSLV